MQREENLKQSVTKSRMGEYGTSDDPGAAKRNR